MEGGSPTIVTNAEGGRTTPLRRRLRQERRPPRRPGAHRADPFRKTRHGCHRKLPFFLALGTPRLDDALDVSDARTRAAEARASHSSSLDDSPPPLSLSPPPLSQIAKRQGVVNPENTFFSVKRFIGRRWDEVGDKDKEIPYGVKRGDNGNVKIECSAAEKDFAAEEISAQVLRKLTDDAAAYLGDTVTKAVITVPAYFNDSQRQATKDAGTIAGIDVLRIINEPTAASLAYGFEKKSNETILIFDLGGGTFDVSILEVGDGVFEVLSTSGDTFLGGDDFDKRIVEWLASDFQQAEGVDLMKDKQALQRLTEAAEKAKMELSSTATTAISSPFITATAEGPKHIDTNLSRAKFEELCDDLITRCKVPVENALRDAKLELSDMDEVILVGGSTRIPPFASSSSRSPERSPTCPSTPTRWWRSAPLSRRVSSAARCPTSFFSMSPRSPSVSRPSAA